MKTWIPGSTRSRNALRASCLIAAAAVLVAACDDDDTTGPSGPFGRAIYGVDISNNLIRFGSSRPDRVTRQGTISGLQPDETIVGIDFRPADGRLYAVGSSSRLYVVDTVTAAATLVGTGPFTPALNGTEFGVDFNPVVDRLRVQSNAQQNLRLDPVTGAVAGVDAPLAYAAGDPGAGSVPSIVGNAYTNSVNPPPATTTLFAIDSNRDVLVTLPSPNDGQLFTIGALGVNTTERVGFDILGSDGATFASLTPEGSRRSRLYTIDVATGTATLVGTIDHRNPLRGISIFP